MDSKNVTIVTAKGGNVALENKNVLPILGVPVVVYPIRAALLSSKTHAVYVSTEDTLIRSIAENQGVKIIDRPAALSQSDSLHKDVIAHVVKVASEEIPSAENFCVLLGNTVMVTPGLIDKSFSILESGEWDSCLSVWKAQDDHPYRALKVDSDGCVQSFLNIDCTSNRQSYPTVFFYDQGIWAFKRDCALNTTRIRLMSTPESGQDLRGYAASKRRAAPSFGETVLVVV